MAKTLTELAEEALAAEAKNGRQFTSESYDEAKAAKERLFAALRRAEAFILAHALAGELAASGAELEREG